MNTPNSPTPGSQSPLEGETSDPKVNAAEQDIITNNDNAESVPDKEGLAADADGITETLSESSTAADLNADNHITNNDSAATGGLEADEQF